MGGRSGSRVASHTPLVKVGDNLWSVTPVQREIVKAAAKAPGRTIGIDGSGLLRSARALADRKWGKLEAHMGHPRWTFTLAEGVEVAQ